VTLLLGFAAVNTGNNLLYLLVSALLGFMAVSGLLGKRNIEGIDLRLSLPGEIFAGQPTLLTVELRNHRRRFPGFLLEVRLAGSQARWNLLAPGETRSRALTFSFPCRGRQPVPEIELCSCFPVSFFYRSFRLHLDTAAVIYPAPIPVRRPSGGTTTDARGLEASRRSGQEGDLRGIGDYQGGEPLKSIHWKLSARQDQLKVKQQTGIDRPPLMIELSSLTGSLEERLGQATHLALQALRENRPTGLRLPTALLPPDSGREHKRRLLTELALYAPP